MLTCFLILLWMVYKGSTPKGYVVIYRMSKYVKRALPLLQVLAKSKPQIRDAIVQHGPPDLIKAISEIVLNVLKGVIKITPRQRKRLARYKNKLRALTSNKVSQKIKRKFLSQKGGGGGLLASIVVPLAIAALSGQV